MLTTLFLAAALAPVPAPPRPCLPGSTELGRLRTPPIAAPQRRTVDHADLKPTPEQIRSSRSDPPADMSGPLEPCDTMARVQRERAPPGDSGTQPPGSSP